MSNRRLEEATSTKPHRFSHAEPNDMDLRIVLDRVEALGRAQVAVTRELKGEFREAIASQNEVIKSSVADVLMFATNANKSIVRLVLLLVALVLVCVVTLAGAAMHIELPGFSVGTGP